MLNILHCYVTLCIPCMHYYFFFTRYQWSIVLCQHSRIISVKFIVKLFIACLLMKGVIETFSHTCTIWSLELTKISCKKIIVLFFARATTMAQQCYMLILMSPPIKKEYIFFFVVRNELFLFDLICFLFVCSQGDVVIIVIQIMNANYYV